ncbi:MAG: RNA-guided endonuclease TnpB family protein [bacterium]
MILAHKIRLRPTPKQEAYFRRACGTTRFTWNWALAEWQRQYAAGEKPSGLSLKKRFNAIRREQFPWTYEVHRDCTARPFDHVQRAFQHFFRRVKAGQKPGYPRFKKKGKSRDSFYIANDKFAMQERCAKLPFVGAVRTREPLRWSGKITGGTVRRDADAWFLVVQVDVGELRRPRTAEGVVGVDLGIAMSMTLSTGEKIEGPRAIRVAMQMLQRLSRQHARKKKGSQNRRKAAERLARLHRRIANIRQDFLHKVTTRLVRENQAVGIEDLNVQGMVRNRKLARSIQDEAFGEFRRQLTYKGPIWDSKIVVYPRFEPSSKKCSDCGEVIKQLPLNVREWVCPACGVVHDRDVNAAMNLKQLGAASPEVTPVERVALARTRVRVQPPSKKQELAGAHLRAPER